MIDIVKSLIQQSAKNSISYSDFMETVLYHPIEGYYIKEQEKVGKEGDFYTSSNVGDIFGKLFAKVFIDIYEKYQLPLVICEFGGGNGRFAKAVLEEWSKRSPETFAHLQYYMIESSPYHLKLQRESIDSINFMQMKNIEELKEKLESFEGIIFSNELFDAFPVDVVVNKDGILYEVRVTVDEDGSLIETEVICEKEELVTWLIEHDINLEHGQRIEIPLLMDNWFQTISRFLSNGLIFTIDYGYTTEEWMEDIHRDGSLRGYYKHQMVKNPLLFPGQMDLTTHIHLDAVRKSGLKNDISYLGMLRQDEFLLRAGITSFLEENYDPNPFSELSKQNRAIRSLITSGISSSFHVIVQQKGLDHIQLERILPKFNTY